VLRISWNWITDTGFLSVFRTVFCILSPVSTCLHRARHFLLPATDFVSNPSFFILIYHHAIRRLPHGSTDLLEFGKAKYKKKQ